MFVIKKSKPLRKNYAKKKNSIPLPKTKYFYTNLMALGLKESLNRSKPSKHEKNFKIFGL